MGGSVSADNSLVVGAFDAALRQQAVIVVLLVVVALLVRAWAASAHPGAVPGGVRWAEHPARRVVRLGFGALWIVDGLLQAQQAMPLGLPTQVVSPAAAGAPGWVRGVVAFGLGIWTRHPVTAAAAVVWIQVGVGLLLVLAPRMRPSQLAGGVSAGWALVVWVFGEAFGSVLTPGQTWMFGLPGSALLYLAAGVALALPEPVWSGRRLGRAALRGFGAFLLGMALLEAWPGRGFWRGGAHGGLSSMVRSMAGTPQPRVLSSLLASFASFESGHGWGVNLALVVVLVALGLALLVARGRWLALAVVATSVVCVAVWVLFEDLGVLGGVGTDPNSMLPTVVLLWAAWLAATRDPPPLASTAVRSAGAGVLRGAGGGAAVVATLAALAVVLVGVVPMAAASVASGAEPVVSEALNGTPELTDAPAPGFRLTDQHGVSVSLAALRGRTVALTFLDPVCTSDCPLIAQQFRDVDEELGRTTTTAFVAVVANPIYRSVAVVDAFDAEEGLARLPNWYYLTGSPAQLRRVWSAYGVEVETIGDGAMVAHSDTAVVIGRAGRVRAVIGANPGDGGAESAALGTVLADQMRRAQRA